MKSFSGHFVGHSGRKHALGIQQGSNQSPHWPQDALMGAHSFQKANTSRLSLTDGSQESANPLSI